MIKWAIRETKNFEFLDHRECYINSNRAEDIVLFDTKKQAKEIQELQISVHLRLHLI